MTRRTAEVRLDALLRTACEVIVQRGLANTRTADIAQAAGVSQALVFYHFSTKERLLAQAFTWAAEQDLARLDAVTHSHALPLIRLRRILKLFAPTGGSSAWAMWIDGWSEALRSPEMEKVSRRLDLRWKEALTEVITAGVNDGAFKCDDPNGAAWRIHALIDGLAVQITVHPRVITRKQYTDWVRTTVSRELGIEPEWLA